MNPAAPNPNPGEPDDGLMSPEELKQWLTEHPEQIQETQRYMVELMERTLRGEFGEVSPEIRAAAEHGLAKRQFQRNIETAQAKFKALAAVSRAPAGSMDEEDRFSQCNALMDELTDLLLEMPEPHRTTWLKQLLPMREKLRALKVKSD
ncbi:MAG: hypothetical protein HY301_16420 [Verrucomicrobia bacterium]|nr:hypothetical protein [Verrucomicrobiota bacterium]